MTRATIEALADAIRPGETLFVPGSAGEPTALLAALAARPERTRGLRVLSTAVPGINPPPTAGLAADAVVTGLFMQPALREAQRDGRFRLLPLSYGGFVRHLREAPAPDTCVVQVSPPDARGRCSLGAAVEFTPLAQARARRTLALLNARMPVIPGAASLPLSAFDLYCEVDTPLPTYDVGVPDAAARAIAGHVAALVEDGATLQAGLGRVPEALYALLHDRRRLRLHSGMLGDGALALHHAGALDPDARHASCVWVGSAALYRALHGLEGFDVLGCEHTHDVARMARLDRLVAVNSALSVDLLGQADLEHAGARAVSGVGGAPDFAQGARLSRGGISVVALPASFGTPPRSRIVPRLNEGTVSLPRHMVDVVVTEHGTADLRGRTVPERARALIAVAAPTLREELERAWGEMRRQL